MFYLGLKGRVERSKFKNTEHTQVLPKLCVIMTKDCYCPGNMKDSDPALNFQERLEFTVTRAGDINRNYGTAVYSVQDDDMVIS